MWTEETFQLVRDGIDAAKSVEEQHFQKNIKRLLRKEVQVLKNV